METLIIIGKVILFIGIWILGIFIRGKIRSDVWGYRSYTPRKKRK